MKKMFAVLFALLLTVGLNGCSKDSFMDLGAFISYYNRVSTTGSISLEDFTVTEGEYRFLFDCFLLTLEETEGGEIEGLRLTVSKTGESGSVITVSEEEAKQFSFLATDILQAYTTLSRQECEQTVAQLGLSDSRTLNGKGELTLTRGDWLVIYYSVEIGSVFMVYNIHLHPTEKTEKPVSKPAYGHTAYTRREAVSLQ